VKVSTDKMNYTGSHVMTAVMWI